MVHIVTVSGKVLLTMNCPKLKNLRDWNIRDESSVEPAIQDFHETISVDNLTVLKLQYIPCIVESYRLHE